MLNARDRLDRQGMFRPRDYLGDEEGLRRVLASYVRYYHRSRLHLSLKRFA